MHTSFWAVVSRNGSITTRKTRPSVRMDEVAIKIDLEIPNALFEKPLLSAKVKIPSDAVSQPEITAEIQDNVKNLIESATGLNIDLRVVEPGDDDNE